MAKLQTGSLHSGKGAPGQTGVQGSPPQELGRSAPDLSPAAGGAYAVAASLQSSQELFLSAYWVHIALLIRTPVLSHPLWQDHTLPSQCNDLISKRVQSWRYWGPTDQQRILGDAIQPITPPARNSTISALV